MQKIIFILKEMLHMIRRHKIAFLAPIFIVLAILSFLVYTLGPAAITAFIYAGV